MKKSVILFLISYLICTSCTSESDVRVSDKTGSETKAKIDSLKWLFYAYTFKSKALFTKDQTAFEFNPTQCEAVVENIENRGDSLICHLRFHKDGFEYKHLLEGLPVYGFISFQGIAKPLIGMVVLDNFDNSQYIKQGNQRTDSAFRIFLKSVDEKQLSSWMVEEKVKRLN